MKLKPFALEQYFAEYEFSVLYLLSCSDCESFSPRELLESETMHKRNSRASGSVSLTLRIEHHCVAGSSGMICR
jgi:hypothetical protein